MNTNVLVSPSSISAKYWSELKDLSDNVKLRRLGTGTCQLHYYLFAIYCLIFSISNRVGAGAFFTKTHKAPPYLLLRCNKT